jgi:hypothetical protein
MITGTGLTGLDSITKIKAHSAAAATSTIPAAGETIIYETSESRFRRQQQENIIKTQLQKHFLGNKY